MIETILLQYLISELDVPVYMEEPENPEPSYVIIEKTGSFRSNHIDTAMMAFQSYGRTLAEAARLNLEVKRAVERSIALGSISAARINSDYNFTDTETKRYRYQCVYNITYYEEE
jgi:hypothetical protein